MPAPSWRTYPARRRSLWLATSASAGASRSVGIKSVDQRCMGKEGTFRPGGDGSRGRWDEVSILNREPFAPACRWLSRALIAHCQRFSSPYVVYMTDYLAEERRVYLIAHCSSCTLANSVSLRPEG